MFSHVTLFSVYLTDLHGIHVMAAHGAVALSGKIMRAKIPKYICKNDRRLKRKKRIRRIGCHLAQRKYGTTFVPCELLLPCIKHPLNKKSHIHFIKHKTLLMIACNHL